MIEDEVLDELQPDSGTDAPIGESEAVPVPQPDPVTDAPLEEGETVQELPSEDDPQPDPDPDIPPMVLIPVEDLKEFLDEYYGQEDSDPEEAEDPEAAPPDEPEEVEDLPAADVASPSVVVDVDLAETEDQLSALVEILDHPALTTSFSDYTVTEAFLLLLFLAVFVAGCARMLRGVFSWLRS